MTQILHLPSLHILSCDCAVLAVKEVESVFLLTEFELSLVTCFPINGIRKRFSVSVPSLGLRRSSVFLLCLFGFCHHHRKDAWTSLLIPRRGWGILSCHNQGFSTKLCSEKIPQMSNPKTHVKQAQLNGNKPSLHQKHPADLQICKL